MKNFGWGLLGFFIPLVGFILWAVWANDNEKAQSGKVAGLAAVVSVLLSIIAIAAA
jgi:hypothetical protein